MRPFVTSEVSAHSCPLCHQRSINPIHCHADDSLEFMKTISNSLRGRDSRMCGPDQAPEQLCGTRLFNSQPKCGTLGAVLVGILLTLTGCANLRPPTDQAPDYLGSEGYSRIEMMELELELLRSPRPPSKQEMNQQMNKAMNDLMKVRGR